ncbi:MAG: hypothetical protein IGS03_01325 [Candidatus Sericytochromatia bacterium]|nr:hypothetical protein [Candidatus Sericytochromatia bacterium]
MPRIQGGSNANQIRQAQAPVSPPQAARANNAQQAAASEANQNTASTPSDQNQTHAINNTPIEPNTAGNSIGRAQFTQQILDLANQPANDMNSFDVQMALESYINDHAGGPETAERFANVFTGQQNSEAYNQLVNDGLNSIRNLPEGERDEALNRFVNLMLNNIDNVVNNNPVVDQNGKPVIAGGPGC